MKYFSVVLKGQESNIIPLCDRSFDKGQKEEKGRDDGCEREDLGGMCRTVE